VQPAWQAIEDFVLCRARRSPLDVTGFVGAVCDHGIIMSAALTTAGEHYRFAATLILRMVEEGSIPAIVYYDIACKFGPWYKRLLQHLPLSPELKAAAAHTKFAVPDFHAHMHVESCRQRWSMQNAAEYLPYMVAAGEATEQLWSYFSDGTLRRLKYMLLQNMKLVLENIFMFLNARHDARLGSWLCDRIRALMSRLARAQADLQQLEASLSRPQVRADAATGSCCQQTS
jgi:Kyakuja-Dileera-Zisupton transposase